MVDGRRQAPSERARTRARDSSAARILRSFSAAAAASASWVCLKRNRVVSFSTPGRGGRLFIVLTPLCLAFAFGPALGALIHAVDEGADFIKANAEDIKAMTEHVMCMIDLGADTVEVLVKFFAEFSELFAGEELRFQRCLADELLAERGDGEGGGGTDEPVAKVGRIGGGELGEGKLMVDS